MIRLAAAFALAAGPAVLALAAQTAGAQSMDADRQKAATCIGGFEATGAALDDAESRAALARLAAAFEALQAQAPEQTGLAAARARGQRQVLAPNAELTTLAGQEARRAQNLDCMNVLQATGLLPIIAPH